MFERGCVAPPFTLSEHAALGEMQLARRIRIRRATGKSVTPVPADNEGPSGRVVSVTTSRQAMGGIELRAPFTIEEQARSAAWGSPRSGVFF